MDWMEGDSSDEGEEVDSSDEEEEGVPSINNIVEVPHKRTKKSDENSNHTMTSAEDMEIDNEVDASTDDEEIAEEDEADRPVTDSLVSQK